MLRAVLLGTGSPPPNPRRRGPATLVSLENEHCLVDAGSGVGAQLVQAGLRPYDWPRLLITHHHSDHTIDLGHLVITRWIVGQNAPLEIWGPAGTRRQVEKLLDYLAWDIEVRRAHMHERPAPEVRVTEIEEGKIFEAGGVTVSAFLVADWVWWLVVLGALVVGLVVLFRSLRRWKSPPPRTPEQIQAEMQLYSESRQTDRW